MLGAAEIGRSPIAAPSVRRLGCCPSAVGERPAACVDKCPCSSDRSIRRVGNRSPGSPEHLAVAVPGAPKIRLSLGDALRARCRG